MTEQKIAKNIQMNEAVDGFYNLKSKYKRDLYNKYIKNIIKDQVLSNNEKRVAFSKLPPAKCVNCKRNVGTIFTVKYDTSTDMKKYIAKCGDLTQPCALDVNFELGTTYTYNDMILEQETILNDCKISIIKTKNDLLFGYLNETESANIFETLTNKLKDATSSLGFFVEKNILVNSNPAKKEVLRKMIVEFGKMDIDYKKMISDFEKTDNVQTLNQGVNYYINEMIPLLKNIQETKYDVNAVEHNENLGTYHLLQLQNSLANEQVTFDADDVIHSYVTGLSNKNITRKNRNLINNTRTRKSRKLSNINFTIQDDDEQDDDEQDDEPDDE